MTDTIPALFKYNSLISVPVFMTVLFLLLHKTKAFSYRQLTVSKSIHLLAPAQRALFRFNFVAKAFIDAGFVWYIATTLGLSLFSPLIILWTAAIVGFGLFAYFTDERGRLVHEIVIYGWIAWWLILEYVSALYTQNLWFTQVTLAIVLFQAVLAFGLRILKKTNAIIQFICVFTLYIWLMMFVAILSQV